MLFDVDTQNTHLGYANLKAAATRETRSIKQGLEQLWRIYEPYADDDFRQAFALHPDQSFWEMYLSTQLLTGGKTLRRRDELPAHLRNTGPDISIDDEGGTIWIEAVTPTRGDATNRNAIPDRMLNRLDGEVGVYAQPIDQVDLRISSALRDKKQKFLLYIENGIVDPDDRCIVAINGGEFQLDAGATGLSRAARSVYPIGDEQVEVDTTTMEVVDMRHCFAPTIDRIDQTGIPRNAFLNDEYSRVSGLLWSRRNIGNFLGQNHDLVFVHNAVANSPFQCNWFPWYEENVVRVYPNHTEINRVGPGVDEEH